MFLEREREREERWNLLYFSRKRIFRVCAFLHFRITSRVSKEKGKGKTGSRVNHVKTILTFRDIKSMYFYGSEDFSKVNKVSSATFSMLLALILWNFEIPLFPQISSGFAPANVQCVLGLTNIDETYPCKKRNSSDFFPLSPITRCSSIFNIPSILYLNRANGSNDSKLFHRSLLSIDIIKCMKYKYIEINKIPGYSPVSNDCNIQNNLLSNFSFSLRSSHCTIKIRWFRKAPSKGVFSRIPWLAAGSVSPICTTAVNRGDRDKAHATEGSNRFSMSSSSAVSSTRVAKIPRDRNSLQFTFLSPALVEPTD